MHNIFTFFSTSVGDNESFYDVLMTYCETQAGVGVIIRHENIKRKNIVISILSTICFCDNNVNQMLVRIIL